MPSLDRLNREYADEGVQVLLINLKEELSSISSFMKKHNYSAKVLLDQQGTVAKEYDVTGIPLSYLIDREGRVVYIIRSNADWDSLKIRALVDNLANEKTKL